MFAYKSSTNKAKGFSLVQGVPGEPLKKPGGTHSLGVAQIVCVDLFQNVVNPSTEIAHLSRNNSLREGRVEGMDACVSNPVVPLSHYKFYSKPTRFTNRTSRNVKVTYHL